MEWQVLSYLVHTGLFKYASAGSNIKGRSMSAENNNYGSLREQFHVPDQGPKETTPIRQSFDIFEPTTPLKGGHGRLLGSCCQRGDTDGFKIIVISMFVFAVGVTVALVITVASDPEPVIHYADVVTSDASSCSQAGQYVLQQGGNAIDAAISVTFCLALTEPHVTGIGGGGMMLIHSHRKNVSTVIDFRETAPENARNDRFIENPKSATFGRTSIGVPGFVKGLEYAFHKYGSGHVGLNCCSWFDLVRKAIDVALRGIRISDHFVNATQTKITREELRSSEARNLRELTSTTAAYFNDVPIFKRLIETLRDIGSNGSATMYQGGHVGQALVQDLAGALTLQDLASYQVIESEPIKTMIGTYEVMASPPPSSGAELLGLLNALEYMNNTNHVKYGEVSSDYLHILGNVLENLEDLQLRLGDSPDPEVEKLVKVMLDKTNAAKWTSDIQGESVFEANYALSDPVAANVAIMDKKDNYVSVVTSLNTWFGSKIMTSNGILLNNAMANFAIPSESVTTANVMAKGKRALSKNVVALTMDTKNMCGTRIATGGSTASSVAQVLSVQLLLNQDLRSSVDAARLDVQNSTLFLENGNSRGSIPAPVLQEFLTTNQVHMLKLPYNPVNVVVKDVDQPYKIDDFRSGENTEDLILV